MEIGKVCKYYLKESTLMDMLFDKHFQKDSRFYNLYNLFE